MMAYVKNVYLIMLVSPEQSNFLRVVSHTVIFVFTSIKPQLDNDKATALYF